MQNRLRLLLAAVAVCAAALVPGAAANSGKVYFNGDFETGTIRQWKHVDRGGGTDRPGAGIVQIVKSPAFRGHAAELTVTPDSHASPAASSDSVFLWNDGGQRYFTAGGEIWEHFRVDFPAASYRASPGIWNWFYEHHQDDGYFAFKPQLGADWNEYPNLCFDVWSLDGVDRMKMRIFGGDDTAPVASFVDAGVIQRDHWYNIVLHVVWQPDSRALTELWVDGRLLYSGHAPNLYKRPDGSISHVNLELSNYRYHVPWSSTIYFDEVRTGSTADAVGARGLGFVPPPAAPPAEEWQPITVPAVSGAKYEWQRCDAAGGACEPLALTSSPLLEPNGSEVGTLLRVRAVPATGQPGGWQWIGPVAVYAGYSG
jgi:hypothetical protein